MNVRTLLTQTVTLLVVALFCTPGIQAEEVTEAQALGQALDFLQARQSNSGSPRKAQSVRPQLTLKGKVSGLFLFDVKDNGGFVIVSGDDRVRPVLGFGESGSIDPDNIPDNMKAWLQGYADEIAWLQQQEPQGSAPKAARSKVGSHSTTAIPPLCTSTWNQNAPYNNLCPTYRSGWGTSRCATGCVATAMAQVMYFHKWPQAATKVIPGYYSPTEGLDLSDLPATTFDWNNMKDSYSGSYTTAQGNAVAKLMQYCGYSVKMDYSSSSGAYTEDVAVALREYFDYNASTTKFVSRSSYTYAKWTDLIYHELSESRPVVYGGLSSGGGHEFVCDGYKYENSTDFFHINWGWGGLSDNYFVLSALDPDQQGIGGSSSTDGFHYGQDAVVGIQKSTDNGTLADIVPNDNNLSVNSITLSMDEVPPSMPVEFTFSVTNNGTEDYDGDIWLCLREEDGDYLVEAAPVFIPAGETTECVITYSLAEEGTYTFLLAYVDGTGEFVSDESQTATLVVAQAVTNDVVPVYGYWADSYSRSQFVIAEADLADMAGSEVSAMTFYSTTSSANWGNASFDVYLKQVQESTISSLKDWSTLDKVYSGNLSIVGNKMVITFAEPYYYEGGNLLVGINQTVCDDYARSLWVGSNVQGASVGGYGSDISQQNFLPKTTFSYTPGTTPRARVPKDLAVSYSGGTEATVSWTSDATAFDLDVNGTITTDVSNPTTLTGLQLATIYNIKVRAKVGDSVSDWTEAVTFTTDLSESTCQIRLELTDVMGDGWNGAAFLLVDVLTGTELGTYTCTDEAEAGVPQTYDVEVPDGRDIEFRWTKGSYDQECSYAAYDVAGNLIFSGSKRPSGAFAHHVDCNAVRTVILASGQDNTALIESLHGTENCTVTLQDRTLFTDGTWNTLCLPFDVTLEGSPLEGADVRTMTGATLEGQTVYLQFSAPEALTQLSAGTPHIVRWTEGEGEDLQNPVFTAVTIDKTVRDASFDIEEGTAIEFKGTYAHTDFADADESILFVGEGNRLNYPLGGATIGAHRAFFKLQGISLSLKENVKQFLMDVGEDDPTAIRQLRQTAAHGQAQHWFTLDGKRLSGKPAAKGIYITKGRKAVIK